MSCPSDHELLAAILGELTVNQTSDVARHRASCARCQRAAREHELLLSDLRAEPELASSGEAFNARVLAACKAAPLAPPRAALRRPRRGILSATLVAAAALLVVNGAGERAQPASISARGEHTAASFAELSFVRDGVLHPLAGARLGPGDALAVRCTNNRDETRYLAVFALDVQNAVHWVYPAFLDERSDPSSLPIPPLTRGLLLPELVEPERPAAGQLRVFALFSARPLHVRELEARLVHFARDPQASLGTAEEELELSEWRAQWHE